MWFAAVYRHPELCWCALEQCRATSIPSRSARRGITSVPAIGVLRLRSKTRYAQDDKQIRVTHPPPTTRNPPPTTRNPQPTTRNPQPATRNPQPATRNPQPATRNPQPATRNPQPATRNPQTSPRRTTGTGCAPTSGKLWRLSSSIKPDPVRSACIWSVTKCWRRHETAPRLSGATHFKLLTGNRNAICPSANLAVWADDSSVAGYAPLFRGMDTKVSHER